MFILKYFELLIHVDSVVNVTTVMELIGIKIAANSGCIFPDIANPTPIIL